MDRPPDYFCGRPFKLGDIGDGDVGGLSGCLQSPQSGRYLEVCPGVGLHSQCPHYSGLEAHLVKELAAEQ